MDILRLRLFLFVLFKEKHTVPPINSFWLVVIRCEKTKKIITKTWLCQGVIYYDWLGLVKDVRNSVEKNKHKLDFKKPSRKEKSK